MRAAGIIRIIVGLVIAVLLTAILVVLLTGNNILGRIGINSGWVDDVLDRTVYTSGGIDEDSNAVIVSDEARVPASNIKKIKIDWVAGNVTLRVGSSDEIVFSESTYRGLTESQKMRYTISNSGVLEIRFREDIDNIFGWLSLDANMPEKKLTMEVPASLLAQLDELNIDSVSANIDLSGVYGMKTKLSTVSGDVELKVALAPDGEISMESVSGDLVLMMPRDLSAEVSGESFSGDLSAPDAKIQREEFGPGSSFRARYGAGKGEVRMETFSGDATLRLQ